MPAKYKLTYFDVRGKAEPIRFILSYGKQEFEEVRFSPEEWPAIKNTMPFGKVPVLEVDGKQISQSLAICRYLASEFGLAGGNEWDRVNIDIVVDTINDFNDVCIDYFKLVHLKCEDQEMVAKKKEAVFNEALPFYMTRFEELVKSNRGYFVNGRLTWVDVYFSAQFETMSVILGADWLDAYPNVLALKNKVVDLPDINAWIEKRPKTAM